MNTKNCTDLDQSKILAKILPIESADMAWCNNSIKGINYTDKYSANNHTVKEVKDTFDKALTNWDKYWELIPCWSFTALLSILPSSTTDSSDDHHFRIRCRGLCTEWHDNPVDAAVEMILGLNKLKQLQL